MNSVTNPIIEIIKITFGIAILDTKADISTIIQEIRIK
jgi:hypothetical protein